MPLDTPDLVPAQVAADLRRFQHKALSYIHCRADNPSQSSGFDTPSLWTKVREFITKMVM
jgi:hypothetical protein